MAQERKAGESGPPAPKMRSVVPVAKKDDIEDVAWALQTAEATWSRGDHADALKWIRRAAEAASEAEADDRALELAKAAADVASLLADRPTAIAPAPPPLPASTAAAAPPTPPPSPSPAQRTPPSPGAPRILTTSTAPPALAPAAARPPTGAPTPSKVGSNAPPLPRPGQKSPTPARFQPPAPIAKAPVSKRGGRRSSPSFADDVSVTATGEVARPRRASTTNETKKRARLSKPASDEIAASGPVTTRQPSTEEIEAWPAQTSAAEDAEDESLYTRVGPAAYREGAQRASARPGPIPQVLAPLVMSQAVRVVVWRGADGVHVAPAGTQVTAIGVEAVLVALDPVADLAAWLSNK
jgi:hypothetical protein